MESILQAVSRDLDHVGMKLMLKAVARRDCVDAADVNDEEINYFHIPPLFKR